MVNTDFLMTLVKYVVTTQKKSSPMPALTFLSKFFHEAQLFCFQIFWNNWKTIYLHLNILFQQ